jgi:S1-C subfamily serine protease
MKIRNRLIGAAAAVVVVGVGAAGLVVPLGASASRAATNVHGIVDIFTSLGLQGEAAAGTGIVLTSSGEILTNNHVIRGATRIHVTAIDSGKTYTGAVVGYSLANDIAVVQLQNAANLRTVSLGSSSSVKAGDPVTGLGNAGGRGGAPSVASGIVLSLDRTLRVSDDQGGSEQLHGLIETNAPLQPGDSGGPLTDGNGNVIGIDTAASSSFSFESGITRGFAIPIDHATAVAAQIVAGRKSATVHIGKTAYMGLSVLPPNDFFGQPSSGITVEQVVPGSPTAKAGLTSGDVLKRFDGQVVNSPSMLTALVVTKYPGDTVPIRWVDAAGTPHTATLTLASGPPQ